MFDNLSERLERSFKILKGDGQITELNVAETLKDLRTALLDAAAEAMAIAAMELRRRLREQKNKPQVKLK